MRCPWGRIPAEGRPGAQGVGGPRGVDSHDVGPDSPPSKIQTPTTHIQVATALPPTLPTPPANKSAVAASLAAAGDQVKQTAAAVLRAKRSSQKPVPPLTAPLLVPGLAGNKTAALAAVVAGKLDAVDDAVDEAAAAQATLEAKLAAAGLPTTAAVKNATVAPAKAKAKAAVQALGDAKDALADSVWAKTRVDAAQNVSARARAAKRAVVDAALASDKGKERLSVMVALNVPYNAAGGDGFAGPQYSASSGWLKDAKKAVVGSVKAALNGTVAKTPAKTTAIFAAGVRPTGFVFASNPASAPVAPVVAAVSPANPGTTGQASIVAFSADTVAGLPGNTFFSPEVVDPYDVANAVRAMLVSKLRALAASGDAAASALLVLGDGSQDGQRTAAPLLSARGKVLDGWAGVYLVSVSFPALLLGGAVPQPTANLRYQLVNAVNDVEESNQCATLAERTGFDVCKAIGDASDLAIPTATLRAYNGALTKMQLLPFGRRSKPAGEAREKLFLMAAAVGAGAPPAELDYASKIFDSSAKIAKVFDKDGAIGKFLEGTGAAGALVSAGWSLVSSIFGLGGKSAQETTNDYLKEINATTYKILDGVTQIQNTLAFVEHELGAISEQITQLSVQLDLATCTAVRNDADTKFISILQNRWEEYVKPTLSGPRFAVEAAMASIQAGVMPNPQPADVYEPWVKKVLAEPGAGAEGVSVEAVLNNLHSLLVSPTGMV